MDLARTGKKGHKKSEPSCKGSLGVTVLACKGSIPVLLVQPPDKPRLTQAGNVVGQRLDLAVIQFGGNLVHLQAVFTNTIAKVG